MANEVAAIRAEGAIVLDGDLDEATWRDAPLLDAFYEIYPGDHIKPEVRTTARFAWDEKYFYVAVEANDPRPDSIRQPFVRRDWVRAGQDYIQLYVDALGTRRGSQFFRFNPRASLTDGLSDEAAASEDETPDFPFEVATRVNDRGWQAEIRIPFSSLRLRNDSDVPWAVMVYRGRFRAQNTQIASGPVTREATCFMCFATTVTGIHTPAQHGALFVTPQFTANGTRFTDNEVSDRETRGHPGLDAKWIPSAGWVIDATINPDFSELEADAPQLTGNVRTVASLPEKRAIFLESLDLLQTPMPYVYTRSIADPELGLRATYRGEGEDATAWIVNDQAGSSVFLPGPFGADVRELPDTRVALARGRWNVPHAGFALDFSNRSGSGYANNVFGIDTAWFPTASDTVLAQWLMSRTRDPLAGIEGTVGGDAWHVEWTHGSARFPWKLRHERIDRGFRADTGYMPSADIDENYAKLGVRFFNVGVFNELQPFVEIEDQRVLSTGATIDRWVAPGVYFEAPRNAYGSVTWHRDEAERAASALPLRRTNFVRIDASISPTAWFPKIRLFGDVGRLMDFDTGDLANGHALGLEVRSRPHDRFELLTTLTHERLNDESGSQHSRTGQAATMLYYVSTATNWRVEWLHHAGRLAKLGELALRDIDQSLSLVFSYRPSWRQSFFAGLSTARRRSGNDAEGQRDEHDEWQVFVKWRRTFEGPSA